MTLNVKTFSCVTESVIVVNQYVLCCLVSSVCALVYMVMSQSGHSGSRWKAIHPVIKVSFLWCKVNCNRCEYALGEHALLLPGEYTYKLDCVMLNWNTAKCKLSTLNYIILRPIDDLYAMPRTICYWYYVRSDLLHRYKAHQCTVILLSSSSPIPISLFPLLY